MQVGLILRYGEQFDPPGRTIGWRELRELARLAEAVGFDTLWVDDHFVYDAPPLVQEGAGSRGFWDAWMLLAALADATQRVTLGPLVACTRATARWPSDLDWRARAAHAAPGGQTRGRLQRRLAHHP
jgi:alkanesulfonate monooxygenase SsuD/methylene tetrahydromethanopterin reductase-like flavin-dependent oxidoreductase (luciferase family)